MSRKKNFAVIWAKFFFFMNYLLQDIKKDFKGKKKSFFELGDEKWNKNCAWWWKMEIIERLWPFGGKIKVKTLKFLHFLFPCLSHIQKNQSALTTFQLITINSITIVDIYSISLQAVTKMSKNLHTIINKDNFHD